MKKIDIWKITIIGLVFLLLTGCSQNEFGRLYTEYQNEYFNLCKSVITDTTEISRTKTYEVSERLQTEECNKKLNKLKELLDKMEKQVGKNQSLLASRQSLVEQYERVLALKNVYGTWNQLSEEQKVKLTREYGIINTLYSMELHEREKKK